MRRGFPYLQILLVALVLAVVLKTFVVDAVVIPSRSMEHTLLVGDYVLVNKLVHGSPGSANGAGGFSEAGIRALPSLRSIEVGDVVVFHFPSDENRSLTGKDIFVKRCVGRAGDQVEMRRGLLSVNGERISVVSGGSSAGENTATDEKESFGPVIVPRAGSDIALSPENIHQWDEFIRREGHTVTSLPGSGVRIDGVPASHYVVQRNYLFVLGDNRDHSFDSRSWGFLPEENVIGTATLIYWSMARASEGISGFFSSVRWNRIGRIIR